MAPYGHLISGPEEQIGPVCVGNTYVPGVAVQLL